MNTPESDDRLIDEVAAQAVQDRKEALRRAINDTKGE